MENTYEKGLTEFHGMIFRMLDGQEVFVEASDDFKVEMLPILNKEQEIAMFNARHPDQFTYHTELTLEQIKEQYPYADVSRVESNLPYSQVKFNEPHGQELP